MENACVRRHAIESAINIWTLLHICLDRYKDQSLQKILPSYLVLRRSRAPTMLRRINPTNEYSNVKSVLPSYQSYQNPTSIRTGLSAIAAHREWFRVPSTSRKLQIGDDERLEVLHSHSEQRAAPTSNFTSNKCATELEKNTSKLSDTDSAHARY
jgi:hypothetical protein